MWYLFFVCFFGGTRQISDLQVLIGLQCQNIFRIILSCVWYSLDLSGFNAGKEKDFNWILLLVLMSLSIKAYSLCHPLTLDLMSYLEWRINWTVCLSVCLSIPLSVQCPQTRSTIKWESCLITTAISISFFDFRWTRSVCAERLNRTFAN